MSLAAGFTQAWPPVVVAAVLALWFPGAAWCEGRYAQDPVGEGQVKAAFLFNFAKFVQWPASEDGLLIIGIVGDDAFAEIVAKTVKGRSISGRELQTRRLALGDDPSGCHVLFVGVMRPSDAAELIRRVRGPVLTVGESVQFLRDGGMVRFYVEKNKMRFQISQRNAEAAGLKVSSQLLTLAAR
jgi:YfiR/HmsC-like